MGKVCFVPSFQYMTYNLPFELDSKKILWIISTEEAMMFQNSG